MDARTAHLAVLATWLGVVLAETVLELAARDEPAMRFAARVHFWIDVVVEAPLLLMVLATGGVLLARMPIVPSWLAIKVVCALGAIGANAYCIGVIVARYRKIGDVAELRRYRPRVLVSALGAPFALAAAALGFSFS